MARSMTFVVNDASTGGTNPAVSITITENADGSLSFSVSQSGGIIGDLRGLFFDVADESLIGTLRTNAATSDFRQGDDSIKDLGDGANMNGLTGSDKGFDVGVEIGSAGIGKDDIQSYSFNLSSTARALTLDDFENVDFGVRLTSVGVIGGSRTDSSKILETTNETVDARDDAALVNENAVASGNLLANDSTTVATSVTGWSGGSLGSAVMLNDAAGATLTVNADGSYSLDASAADALSAGEVLTYHFTYNMASVTADQTSSDSAAFSVTVVGANDGPVAQDDAGGSVAENAVLNGDVTGNDSDVDRLDTHTWALVEGSFAGEGSLTMNADGTWSYDAMGAYDYLNDGDSVNLSFQYTMTDNHGASDTATVSFTVTGVGSVEPPPPPPPSGDSYPTFSKDISHAVLVFDTNSGDRNGDGYYTVKIDGYGGDGYTELQQTDLDASIADILAWLVANDANIDANTEFLGAQIKGGNVGTARDSYDDYWANDGDNSYTIATIANTSGSGTTTEWVSGDAAPVDMSQEYQNQVDTTYQYAWIV